MKAARSVWSGGKAGDTSKAYLSLFYIDIETFSSVDLTRAGSYRYCESDDFEILLLSYAVNDGEVYTIDFAHGEKMPEFLQQALHDGKTIFVAHNAGFERIVLSKFFHHPLPIHQWRCTRVWASYHGLPASLEDVGQVLGLSVRKMPEGKRLIKRFSVPDKLGERAVVSREDPEWQTFREYNERDTEVTRQLWQLQHQYPLPDREWELYFLDQRMNDRGVKADIPFVRAAQQMDQAAKADLLQKAKAITGLSNPNSPVQLQNWLKTQGIQLPDLCRETVAAAIPLVSNDIQRVLTIRQELSQTSTKKYQAILDSVSSDGYLRGMMQFYGAGRTGRWSAKRVQIQNLKRNSLDQIEKARELGLKKRGVTLELIYGSVSDVVSQLVRTALIPETGKHFLVADFSAIEARVLAYMAQEQWRLSAFADGEDLYCRSASMMWGVPVVKNGVNGHLRQKGKIAELALGYGGSVNALIRMGALQMGLNQEELPDIVSRWRRSNPAIVDLWSDVDQAIRRCISKRIALKHRFFTIDCDGEYLSIQLPSGRKLFYRHPRLEYEQNRLCFAYDGMTTGKGWGTVSSYGAKVVENITQAIARDVLAEALFRLEEAGYDLVFTVHDEVVISDSNEKALDDICRILHTPPSWAPALNLKAEGYVCDFYMKK